MKSVINGAGYILVHTPDMVLHNVTTQTTERIVNHDGEYLKELLSEANHDMAAEILKAAGFIG